MRLFGILLLSVVPIIFSIRAGEEVRKTEKKKEAMTNLLCTLHFQIENFLKDQREIFANYEDPLLKNTSFYKELEQRLEKNPCGAFQYAWKLHGKEFAFDAQTNELLSEIANHFGFLEKKAQLEQLAHGIAQLEKTEPTRKAECENKIKILRMSGITAGLGLFILLI